MVHSCYLHISIFSLGNWQNMSQSSPGEGKVWVSSLIARFMGSAWGPSGADRTQVGPMLAPWTLPSGFCQYKAWPACYFVIVVVHVILRYIGLWYIKCHLYWFRYLILAQGKQIMFQINDNDQAIINTSDVVNTSIKLQRKEKPITYFVCDTAHRWPWIVFPFHRLATMQSHLSENC